MNYFRRKLYAILQISGDPEATSSFLSQLDCFASSYSNLESWWHNNQGNLSDQIASTSDRVNLTQTLPLIPQHLIEVRHPISGQKQQVQYQESTIAERVEKINAVWAKLRHDPDLTEAGVFQEDKALQRLFWWCWRFYPDQSGIPLLTPSHTILPDNPVHSYNSAVSALAGTLFPPSWQNGDPEQPYLLLFTFSPVQEFIKASRKFLDFWAGSYLLHYLSARLCWFVAQKYGPDSVITPSLWGQEIIDAFLAAYPECEEEFKAIGKNPVTQFNQEKATFLSTAGFPNTLTVIAPGKAQAQKLGEELADKLKKEWSEISRKVRLDIRSKVQKKLKDSELTKLSQYLDDPVLQTELERYTQDSLWEWKSLWEAQINNTWEPYFVVVPLGNPEFSLSITGDDQDWIEAQNTIAQPRIPLPTAAETEVYETFNVGTWWGSYQARLGQLIQAVKNTRSWQIPVAPGERSTLSGQFSAVHPRFNYKLFSNGRGMSIGSMQLFWKVMAIAYPGLFNGSERLNALELTKRMAWQYGGVAQSLGVTDIQGDEIIMVDGQESNQTESVTVKESERYEHFIRFPNLTSIAMANFATHKPAKIRDYWKILNKSLKKAVSEESLSQSQYDRFRALTRRPSQIQRVDQQLLSQNGKTGYNGVMFSAKWLADDLGLTQEAELRALRNSVSQAHIDAGFGDASPSDWWVLVLGDGDSMGKYVSGNKLKNYENYIPQNLSELKEQLPNATTSALEQLLQKTKKRMGPGTHIGLNRALIDFSNRLVPYLTEERCCGRVIYSGGDDVMAALPLADLPKFLRSLRAAWSGAKDPEGEFSQSESHDSAVGEQDSEQGSGYWKPDTEATKNQLADRPLFTMGDGATMSLGIIIAHKSVPLPTVLENVWDAEKNKAKKMLGATDQFPNKDGLCFRVIYGSGNILEALMKGELLEPWWKWLASGEADKSLSLAPVLYRLSEELPKHCEVTASYHLFKEAAGVILSSRDNPLSDEIQENLLDWIDRWECWAWAVIQQQTQNLTSTYSDPPTEAERQAAERQARQSLGTRPEDLANLLRFSAFWVSRRQQELNWE
jgi:CRISPR-associated protein Cmr2